MSDDFDVDDLPDLTPPADDFLSEDREQFEAEQREASSVQDVEPATIVIDGHEVLRENETVFRDFSANSKCSPEGIAGCVGWWDSGGSDAFLTVAQSHGVDTALQHSLDDMIANGIDASEAQAAVTWFARLIEKGDF